MSDAPSAPAPGVVDYVLTSWVSATAFIVTLAITCALFYYIVIAQSWRHWRFCRYILPGVTIPEEDDLEDATDSEARATTEVPSLVPIELDTSFDPISTQLSIATTPSPSSSAIVLGPLRSEPVELEGYTEDPDAQSLLSSAMYQPPAIDLVAGQELLNRFFAVHQKAVDNHRHHHVAFMETVDTKDPAVKMWKCAWCGINTSFPALFTNRVTTGNICRQRDAYNTALRIDSSGFGGSNVGHQRSKNDLSFDIMPLERANTNRRVFNGRIYKEYKRSLDLFETPVIESPAAASVYGSGNSYSFNVVDAYFEWIHPWGEYSDIEWVQKTRKTLYLPPGITDLITQFEGDGGMELDPADDSSAQSNESGTWLFTDGGVERAPITTTFIPFVVFMTDVHCQ